MSSSLRASASEFVPGRSSSSSAAAAAGAASAAGGVAPPGAAAGLEDPAQQDQQEHGYYWDEYEGDEYEQYYADDDDDEQQQQQQQQGLDDVALSAEQALALLRQWYPGQPPALLRQLLDACGNDLQDVLAVLTDIELEQRAAARTAAQAAATDSNGGGSISANAAASTGSWAARRSGQFSLAAEAFPELHASAQQSRAARLGADTSAVHASNSAAGLWEQQQQQQPGGRGGGSSWAAVAGKAASAAVPAGRSSVGAAASSSGVGTSVLPRGRHAGRAPDDAGTAVPWVTTGAAVSAEYANARAEARDYARVRNACFHQATLAYLAGDKALAKQLSAKGKEAAQQMWAAHEAASAGIFASRNSALARGRGPAAIDLHGLHVREVQAVLPERLAALAAEKHASVSLIVGTGHHTKGPPSARLGPAVEALLQRLGYHFREVQPGLLRVELL